SDLFDVVPMIVEPVKMSAQSGLVEGGYGIAGIFFGRQKERKKRAGIAGVIVYFSEGYSGYFFQFGFEDSVVLFLYSQNFINFFQLSHTDGSMQFRHSEVVSQTRMQIGTSVCTQMVMAVVAELVAKLADVLEIGHHGSALRTSHGFYKIE